ncbi:hypothetical protein ACH4TQ_08505 [Streptomyces sp. NPDC021218]|uniref:hypothetical protein n=1 Tax=unclassified Streptomyces TaxID=2593676 RepID=UPI0036A7F045
MIVQVRLDRGRLQEGVAETGLAVIGVQYDDAQIVLELRSQSFQRYDAHVRRMPFRCFTDRALMVVRRKAAWLAAAIRVCGC